MKNLNTNDFKDELGEQVKDVGEKVVVGAKGYAKIAKAQIMGTAGDDQTKAVGSGTMRETKDNGQETKVGKMDDGTGKKIDPVTGKPVIKKQTLTHLTTAANQLRLAKLKKIREELEKQRLKVTGGKEKLAPLEAAKNQGAGPVMPGESAEKQPKEDVVAKTLKGSKSTGEFKGLIGG